MKSSELNDEIHDRDGDMCIIDGRYVDRGEKWHHEKKDGIKVDNVETGVTICYGCHQERHFGKHSREIRDKCRAYLRRLYPDYWR